MTTPAERRAAWCAEADQLDRELANPFADGTMAGVLGELQRSCREQRDALAVSAAMLGLRLEVGPVEVRSEPVGPGSIKVTATMAVRIR